MSSGELQVGDSDFTMGSLLKVGSSTNSPNVDNGLNKNFTPFKL
jgi:hypothetical protein